MDGDGGTRIQTQVHVCPKLPFATLTSITVGGDYSCVFHATFTVYCGAVSRSQMLLYVVAVSSCNLDITLLPLGSNEAAAEMRVFQRPRGITVKKLEFEQSLQLWNDSCFATIVASDEK